MLKEIISSRFKKKTQKIIESNPIIIQVDVTPSCDYAQDKGYTRMLSGVLIDKKCYEANEKNNLRNPAALYTLCPILNINSNDYYLIFDFRYFKSLKQELVKEIYKNNPKYRIRSQLLIDLQACLSNHINRPGIVSVI